MTRASRTRLQLSQAGVAAATLLLTTTVARAQEAETDIETGASAPQLSSGLRLALRLEPGLAMAMTDPQSDLTGAGLSQTVKLMVGVTRYLELGPSATFTTLPGDGDMAESGRAWTVGGGVRLMRPHDAGHNRLSAISPWVDADALYVRTGDLDRPGFALGAGASVPIDQRRRFWIGPYVRYFQIVQGDRSGYDNRDAQILSVGLSLEVGSGLEQRRTMVVADDAAELEVAAAPIADRDGDGVADGSDNCPDVSGLADNAGCPPYQKVAVLPDKLEVKDKIAFEWNSSKLDASSRPALDEVAQALEDNPSFRVEVAGHASADGNDDYNQELSEQRAETVVTYLVSRGVARDRLTSRGFSSSVPTETNTTVAGRVSNRRVEFSVHLILVNDGNTP